MISPASAPAEDFGDQRNGVSRATHLVLDLLDAHPPHPASVSYLLARAQRSVAAAQRAMPENGSGRRRISQAREAAALLLLALDRMDDTGREVTP